MYNFCPSALKVKLQLAPAWNTRSASLSISKFSSIFVLGSSLSSNASKKEYLLRGISQLTSTEVPNTFFLK